MFLRTSLAFYALSAFCFGDTLYLRSGAAIQGSFAGGDTRQMKMIVGDHVETYRLEEIQRLEFGSARGGDSAMAAPPAPRYTEQNADSGRFDRNTPPPPPAPRYSDQNADAGRFDRATPPPPPAPDSYNAPNGMEIPAGTNLVVRLIDNVDSERDSIGKTYRASIDEPVVVNGADAAAPRRRSSGQAGESGAIGQV